MRTSLTIIVVALGVLDSALAHPHPSGIVVAADGTVIVGDFLQPRLVVIERSGQWREIRETGYVRALAQTEDGSIYGVSIVPGQGSSLWRMSADERRHLVVPNFHGLFAPGEEGSLALAAADSLDRRPLLEILDPVGQRTPLATFEQVESLTRHDDGWLVADGSAVRRFARNGAITTVAEEVGQGLFGLAIGPNGPIVAAYHQRAIFELADDGTRRVLLTSEPPWAPTAVTFRDGALYVVEFADDSQGWRGPRVRRVLAHQRPQTLFVVDKQSHVHAGPWFGRGLWMLAGAALAALAWVGLRIARARWPVPARHVSTDPRSHT